MAPLVKWLFFFLFGLALAFMFSLPREVIRYVKRPAPPLTPGYDYFKLALQWPPSVNERASNLRNFTIHGLWPGRYAEPTPTNCSPAPPYDSMPKNLTNLLDRSWPDVLKGNNIGFWTHEWNKHGKCSSNRFHQTPYFRLADRLRTQHNVLSYLKKSKIFPGKEYHEVQQFEYAVRKEINYCVINMQCNGNGQLKEIRICFDYNGTSVVNCPTTSRGPYGNCGGGQDNITLPEREYLPPLNANISFPKAEKVMSTNHLPV